MPREREVKGPSERAGLSRERKEMAADYETENLKGWAHETFVHIRTKDGIEIGNFSASTMDEILEIIVQHFDIQIHLSLIHI